MTRPLTPYQKHKLQEQIKALPDAAPVVAVQSKTDTPRTDKIVTAEYPNQYEAQRALTRHARELERELLAALVAVGTVAVRTEIKRRVSPISEKYDKFTNDQVWAELQSKGCIGARQRDAEE